MTTHESHTNEIEYQKRLLDLIDQAIDLPKLEREEFVRRKSAGNDRLATDVLRALESDFENETFLAGQATEAAAMLRTTSSTPPPMTGRIGRYELMEQIGTGGMGNVYRASHDGDGYRQEVAIKVIKRGMDTDAVISRFRLERHILASLNHPSIARMIDAGTTDDGRAYFVMEYVEGQPITRYADNNKLSISERLALFQDVCNAVQYAHRNLVIHRDIKPSNILVTPAGRVMLLDFGIAKLLNPEHAAVTLPMTSDDAQFLTPEYASPEHIRREPMSTASDVYSLGVLLYEMLSGHRPFDFNARSRADVIDAVCHTQPTRPSEVVGAAAASPTTSGGREKLTPAEIAMRRSTSAPDLARRLAGDLDTIVLKALRKQPGERYATADQLREDVERFTSGLPIAATPATVAYRLRKFYDRNRLAVVLAASAGVLLVALTTGWIVTLAHQRDQLQTALKRAEDVRAFAVNVLSQGRIGAETNEAKTLAALTLIRPALAELDTEVGDDPTTRVAVMNVAANILLFLDAQPEADSLLRAALAIARDHPVAVDDRLETLQQLGIFLERTGKRDSSAAVLEPLLDEREKRYGRLDERTLDTIKWLTMATGREANPERYQETIRRYEERYGPTSIEVADLLSDIGQGGDTTAYLERALDIYRLHGDLSENPGAAGVLATLALTYETSDPDRALEMTTTAADILEKQLGRLHDHTITARGNLAAIYYDRGDYLLADSLLADTDARRNERVPGSAVRATSTMYYRGLTKLALGQFPEAESFFRHSLDGLEENHPRYTYIVRLLTIAIGKQRPRKQEAAALIRRDIERLEELPDPPDDDLAAHREILAKLEAAIERDGY